MIIPVLRPIPLASSAVLFFATFSGAVLAAAPEKAAPSLLESVDAVAFVDGYLGVNYGLPRPTSDGNQLRAFDAENGFALHWFGLDLSVAPDPVGGTLGLRLGPSAALYAGSDAGVGLENVKQAFVSVKPGRTSSLVLDFGKWDTPFGAEVADSQLDMNYTRGAVYWFAQPLFHTGLRLRGQLADSLAFTLFGVNGVNATVDNNLGKSFGLQLAFTPADAFQLTLGYMGGPEQPDSVTVQCGTDTAYDGTVGACVDSPGASAADVVIARGSANTRFRHLGDVIVTLAPSEEVRAVLNGTYGTETLRPLGGEDERVSWFGLALAASYTFRPELGLALRGELLRDPQGFVTGTGAETNLLTGTLTLRSKPWEHLTLLLDNRVDRANEPLFRKHAHETSKTQVTTTLGVIVTTN